MWGLCFDFHFETVQNVCAGPSSCPQVSAEGLGRPTLGHEIRIGGTQKLDGFFASFRREVGKKSFNTTGPSPETADAMESQLHERMRTFQFLYWFSFTDALQVFGEMRKLERVSVQVSVHLSHGQA